MKKVGLYFGSFNPIHIGHIQVSEYIRVHGSFDEVWFVPSPLNPHKSQETLIPSDIRLKWVQMSIEDLSHTYCVDDEFYLPRPSYTHKSVLHFKSKYPDISFGMIMGADNLYGFHKWQHADELARICPLHVYARPGFEKPPSPIPFQASWYDAPLIDISATEIRDLLYRKGSINHLVPQAILPELIAFFQSVKAQP